MRRCRTVIAGVTGVIASCVLSGCAGGLMKVSEAQSPGATPAPAEASVAKVADKFIDPATGMELVYVQGGCFKMGSDTGAPKLRPRHEVCVDGFYLGKFEVTQGAWQAIMGSNNSAYASCGPDCPVETVSWLDTQEFIKRLNAKTGENYRLPTEAEWEYAARSGGRDDAWAGTSNLSQLGDYAWFESNSEGKTHKVGQKKANGLGLYDMSGNVYEWCQDYFSETYYQESPKDNPIGPTQGDNRVLRGGSWADNADAQLTGDRGRDEPGGTSPSNGFRLLRPAK